MNTVKCPRCNSGRFWRVRRRKLKCAQCKYEWTLDRLPLRLTRGQWEKILSYFVQDLSSTEISSRTGIGRKRVLRALQKIRTVMGKDLPNVFDGDVEVGHMLLEGRWKVRTRLKKVSGERRKRPKRKTIYVLGVLSRNTGEVWTTIVSNLESKRAATKIRQRIKPGSKIYTDFASEKYRSFIPAEFPYYIPASYDYQLLPLEHHHSSSRKNLDAFWNHLKRNFRDKPRAGVRLSNLPLYVASYTWLYNHRNLTKETVNLLLERLEYYVRVGIV